MQKDKSSVSEEELLRKFALQLKKEQWPLKDDVVNSLILETINSVGKQQNQEVEPSRESVMWDKASDEDKEPIIQRKRTRVMYHQDATSSKHSSDQQKDSKVELALRAKQAYHRKKEGAIMEISRKDKLFCIDLILRLCSLAHLDPMAILREHRRSLHESLANEITDNIDPSMCRMEQLAALCQEEIPIPGNHTTDLFACMALAAHYRLTLCRNKDNENENNKEDTKKANDEIESIIAKHKAHYSLRAGIQALTLCWAVSPRNMFGLIVLSAMSLSKADIHKMSKGLRCAFITLFTNHWSVDEKMGIPKPVCKAINAMIRVILPASELMLIINLTKEKEALVRYKCVLGPVHRQNAEDSFGFRYKGLQVFMPRPFLLSNDFTTRNKDEKKANLLRSALVIEHPTAGSLYDCQELLTGSTFDNLIGLQNEFFHKSIDFNKTPIPVVKTGEYPYKGLPLQNVENYGNLLKYQSLAPCLAMSIWLLCSGRSPLDQRDRAHLKGTYAPLDKAYMDSHQDVDKDSIYSTTVTLEKWKRDEEESTTID